MRTRASVRLRFVAVLVVLGSLGLAATGYILVKQRAPVPFRSVYTVQAQFSEADGVSKGIGQPVNVVGVKVGQVSGVRLADGRAVVTMSIERSKLPRVHTDATAVLEPITPLEDMQIALDPGRPPAAVLPAGATLGVSRTDGPVAAAEVLSVLDADTRTYLSSLLAALDEGTNGRAPDIRRVLLALGPTTAQAGRVSKALAARRIELARLVHNLAVVTRATSRDDRLGDVILAGNRTLEAIAAQRGALQTAIAEFPATLGATRATLARLSPFAAQLRPALTAALPAIRRLPETLRTLGPFAELGTRTLARDVRPLVRDARPLVRSASPAVADLDRATPDLASALRSTAYLFNELAYNAPGDDEGFLFWLAWAGHNLNSAFSTADAHGNLGRATRIVDCNGVQSVKQLRPLLDVGGLCPE